MKEAFELIRKRLEPEADFFSGEPMGSLQKAYYCKGVEKAMEIVSEVEAEYGNGWIPVERALPEKSGRVLVSYESINDEIAVSETSYDYKRKTFWISPCVLAWMPLPEAYKPTND